MYKRERTAIKTQADFFFKQLTQTKHKYTTSKTIQKMQYPKQGIPR